MSRWTITLLELLVLGIVMKSEAQTEPEVFQDVDCTDDTECESAKPGSRCELVDGQDGQGNAIERNKCACIADMGWHKKEDNSGCVRDVPTTMECHLSRSKCVDANAACINDGTNTGTKRCLCMSGYLTVQSADETKYMCGKVITSTQDDECNQCIQNGGMCYDTDGDDQKDGCQCKLSQTGDNCETVHLSVTCTSDTTSICYGPVQEGVDFSAGSKLYTDGHEADMDCLGVVLTNDTKTSTCGEGHVLLTLPLGADKRGHCGTKEIAGKTTRLETMVTVTKAMGHDHLHFTTYCEYQLYTDGVFQNIHVKAAPGNDRGEFKTGELILYVHDSNGLPMGSDPSINSGDPVQFLVKLKEDDPPIHTAIKVHRCMLSTSGTIKTGVFANNNENTLQVIDEGCPDEAQKIFNENNTFVRNGKGDVTTAQTGLVPIPKFGNSPNIFLHCNIILCTAANIDLCNPEVECGANNFTSVGRKKREAVDIENDAEVANAVFSLKIKDKNTNAEGSSKGMIGSLATTEFAAMMVVMAAALVAFIVIATLFVWTMKNKDGKIVEYRHDKPQQFAMPRMERNLKI